MKRIDFQNVRNISKKLTLKDVKNNRVKLPEQKPDKFEHSQADLNLENDMGNMKFKAEKIQFYPEDLEKMKTMTDDEQIDFAIKLREEERYTVIKDKPPEK